MRRKPELTIAPLIDVVFLLLIFFVCATTFTQTGVEIKKPTAEKVSILPRNAIIFSLTKEGKIYYNRREIHLLDVRREVAERLKKDPKTSVIILADKRSLTGAVVDILDEAKIGGAKRLAISARIEPAP
jgi:biopolymer transport protein ExbD